MSKIYPSVRMRRFHKATSLFKREQQTNKYCDIGSGYLIPKGWKVMPLFRNIHHNPEFFAEPQKFDPTRFEVRFFSAITVYVLSLIFLHMPLTLVLCLYMMET